MSVATIEGIVENGQVRLPPGTQLPERAKVFIVIPGGVAEPATAAASKASVYSPRLAHPEQAADFIKRVEPAVPPSAEGA
jgi:hypothetical protein